MLVKRNLLGNLPAVDPAGKPETAGLTGDAPDSALIPDDSMTDDTALWSTSSTLEPNPAFAGGQNLIDAADKARERLRR